MNERTQRDERGPEPSLGDIVDGAVRRIVTGFVIAGAFIGLAIYSRPGPPRYQAFATDTGIVRVNTRSGTVIVCEPGRRCAIVVQRGQGLDRRPAPKAVEAPAAPPAPKALPAPAAAPAPSPKG